MGIKFYFYSIGLILPGSKGPKGEPGIPGRIGADGAPGPPGPKGATGEPNYHGYGSTGPVGQKVVIINMLIRLIRLMPPSKIQSSVSMSTIMILPPLYSFSNPQGEPGETYAFAAKGQKGEPGIEGSVGEPGYHGSKGNPGAPGENGNKHFAFRLIFISYTLSYSLLSFCAHLAV